MRRITLLLVLATLAVAGAFGSGGAQAHGGLHAGFGVRSITPHGPSPDGWDFWVNPKTGIWSEQFTDLNDNGYFDAGEPFVDDVRNTQLDPQSAAKFDGCWTNAGFSGRGPLGVFDDVWARAVVLQAGDQKVAMVSLDAVGFFYEEIERIRTEMTAKRADHGVDMLVVSSTHTHESCDTMGYWGNPPIATDGKFPLWQKYIRSQIVDAVLEASDALEPAEMKASTVRHEDKPLLDENGDPVLDKSGNPVIRPVGLRDSRDPTVMDPFVQSAQFVRPGSDEVIGTVVRWSNHPEALASENRYISSDFPHGTRVAIENATNAPAVYFSGSVGGLMTPLRVDMGTDPETGEVYGITPTPARAYYIGRLVAEAALAGLATATPEPVEEIDIRAKEVFMTADNVALRALNQIGIFDKPTYVGGMYAERWGDEFKTQIVTVKVGSARFQTVPGELFPEIEIGGYGRTNCPAGKSADTGRPYEPVIRDQFTEEHLFVLGLGQDELGYIVPGYDFWADGPKLDNAAPQAGTRTPRPIVSGFGNSFPLREDPCGKSHYEESVSSSSVMAPVVACTIAELAGKDPFDNATSDPYKACSKENTTLTPYGIHLDG
ncbi:MAG TPA: hypothetical protein VM600_08840 [Actinomycetota bacterium]|nr:hypothetical protein [Actinomycetota bacterium]